jgi:hypothetical protein
MNEHYYIRDLYRAAVTVRIVICRRLQWTGCLAVHTEDRDVATVVLR